MATDDIATAADRTLTCSGDDSVCVGDERGTENAVCAHNYVLCVTCEERDSVAYIRVQANGMFNHCWRSNHLGASGQYRTYDFETVWNPDVYGKMNYGSTHFEDTNDTENILCDINRT